MQLVFSQLKYAAMSTDELANLTTTAATIAENVAQVRERIVRAASRTGRWPDEVRLVAVTKTVDAARIREAVAAGVAEFAENYVQEARAKIPEVSDTTSVAAETALTWHFIGHLQSNKARFAIDLFSLLHSIDSMRLAEAVGRHAAQRGRIMPVLIEVNLSGGDNRAGTPPEKTLELAERIARIEGIELRGLMGIAPQSDGDSGGDAGEAARPYFQQMRRLWQQLPAENRQVLSMGMSADFEAAIEEGATLVRIGTAIFGQRSRR